MAPIADFHDVPTNRELTLNQIATAIRTGAEDAGWRSERISDSQMLASYRLRNHTVIVTIDYSSDDYSIVYRNSFYMKVVCPKHHPTALPTVTTGDDPCPDGAAPRLIHRRYNDWVQKLNNSIRIAIALS